MYLALDTFNRLLLCPKNNTPMLKATQLMTSTALRIRSRPLSYELTRFLADLEFQLAKALEAHLDPLRLSWL